MRDQLENGDGILVYFNTVTWRWELPSENELKEQLPLRLIARGTDASIYKIDTKE
jgi:hypothetical protein